MTLEGHRTGSKPRYTLRNASVDEQCFRFSNVSGFRSAFGVDPELGVDEGPRSDRIFQSFLQRDWDGHSRGCNIYNTMWFEVRLARGSGEAGYVSLASKIQGSKVSVKRNMSISAIPWTRQRKYTKYRK